LEKGRSCFVLMSLSSNLSFADICIRYQISRQTGYKWIRRYKEQGREGLADNSHRPRRSPNRTPELIENRVIEMRQRVPEWGARKIRWLLEKEKLESIPSERTITHVLKRHGLISPEASAACRPWQRFEYPVPNALWQMDFKGPIKTLEGWSHPLTVLDDHSRFNMCLKALPNEKGENVRTQLTATFRRYGIPDAILADNGGPWGKTVDQPLTELSVWLMKVGIRVTHSRPHHPQTVGKDERFHETLNRELLRHYQWQSIDHMQLAFIPWRERYNCERPHEAIGMEVPASRYQPSQRSFPETLPEPEYPGDVMVRKVDLEGRISFQNRMIRISKAFRHQYIGIKSTETDGIFDVFFSHNKIKQFNLKYPKR